MPAPDFRTGSYGPQRLVDDGPFDPERVVHYGAGLRGSLCANFMVARQESIHWARVTCPDCKKAHGARFKKGVLRL